MDRKYDALDWQSFSQKKDIEEIVKNTQEKKDIEITATVEIAMLISSIIAPYLFEKDVPRLVWFIIAGISILPLFWLIVKLIIVGYRKRKPAKYIKNVAPMVSLFDNDICYYALMAESYAEKVKNIETENISDVDQFNFIETCFYINKAIYNLARTTGGVDILYSVDSEQLFTNRKISYTRLKNIFNILDGTIEIINNNRNAINGIDVKQNYLKVYEEYLKIYDIFKQHFYVIDPSLKK